MPPGAHIHIHTRVVVIVAAALLMPLTVLAVPSEQQFLETKDAFDQLWHSAAETTKRRADLEENLQQFDVKVQQARQDLEEAVRLRKDLRERVRDRRELIDVLQQQIRVAGETEAFYRGIADHQRDDYIAFVRYVASKEIALQEAGPSAGGPVLRRILRGSLGESIDEELAYAALLKARSSFLRQAGVLVAESGRAQERLQNIAGQLTSELEELEGKSKVLENAMDKKAAFIDDSWRQRKLTEEELKNVAQEAQEAQSRIASMQTSLLAINAKLKEERLKEMRSALASLETDKAGLGAQRQALQRKETAIRLLQETAMRALQTAMQQRNTDKKLYKRLEQEELSLKEKKAALGALTGSGTVQPIAALTQEVALLKEVIALMRDGIPAEPAKEYVRARYEAEGVAPELSGIAANVQDLTKRINELTDSIGVRLGEIETTEQQTGLEGLPPLFSWPATGPLTATYLDPDYERVFGIPHQAIDIAVPQGSPVKAIAEGIVFAVKDGGATGYSYVLIGHRNGFASLYGHVSLALVKVGDRVRYGQTIALSGGRPGTRGAGPMTTGSHLHLEMMKDGKQINPLTVLQK
ncbi:MAG: peptidoglycan DD-metalloendopeptidase family protein [Candidatus Peribacteraceae bacterium]